MFRQKNLLVALPTSLGMFFLILSLALLVSKTSPQSASSLANFGVAATNRDVTLSFSPKEEIFSKSEDGYYPVGVLLDSADKKILAADAIIRFDPQKGYVDPKVTTGTLLEHYPVVRVDNSKGEIVINALNFEAKTAVGFLANFRFRPLTFEEVRFTFDFRPGEKLDSNVVGADVDGDILTKVEEGKYDFK